MLKYIRTVKPVWATMQVFDTIFKKQSKIHDEPTAATMV